jgi:hypothetical protein
MKNNLTKQSCPPLGLHNNTEGINTDFLPSVLNMQFVEVVFNPDGLEQGGNYRYHLLYHSPQVRALQGAGIAQPV